ncbi:class III poly(R)-hydroxyalkanoic acid synthase subunit PhaC [Salinirubellus sp. GCM10025818]|uniref:class III poly(R)-hydroxyalkanoic acid synthase subunit PhaC n=1 Tax=Salinirubellus TaxID=2162630 RepID=UPI00361F34ED
MTDNSWEPTKSNPVTNTAAIQREVMKTAADVIRKSAIADDRLTSMASVDVGETPSEVVYTENKLELLHYEPLTESQHDVPILVVYALINKPFILDLQPDRSVVRRLLEAGHDVYLIDWGEPSRLDVSLGIYDYVERYIDNCVDVVRDRSGQDAINVLGYCMGGTLSTIYAALHPEKVKTLGLMATGLYFEDSGGILELWGDGAYYDSRGVTEMFGTVPAEFLAIGFALMDPIANYLTKYVHLYDRLENEDFVENFARMERWLSDGVDVASEVYVQFLEDIYQSNCLYRNELEVGGEHVDIMNLDMPVLQIVGEYDNLVPNEASLAFNDVIPADVTVIQYPTGHVGLSMSDTVHRDVWPEVAEWFFEQSGAPSLADVIGEGIEEVLGYDVETDVTVGGADEVEVRIAGESGHIDHGIVQRDVESIRRFVEDALGVDIRISEGSDGIVVQVQGDETAGRVVVMGIAAAISEEIEEAIEDADLAAAVELEDVEGIGPTYAGRLREAGIEDVMSLATTEPETVAAAAEATRDQAQDWVESARDLAEG